MKNMFALQDVLHQALWDFLNKTNGKGANIIMYGYSTAAIANLAEHFGIPHVLLTWSLDVDLQFNSYMPGPLLFQPTNFLNRWINFIGTPLVRYSIGNVQANSKDRGLPFVSPLKTALILVYSEFPLEHTRDIPPNIKFVGPLIDIERQKIDTDISEVCYFFISSFLIIYVN